FETALQAGYIFPYYQPQINHCTKRMIGAEALMRWVHPEYGMQSPADFIPILEKHDLLYFADLAIFEAVCRFLHERLNSHSLVVPISVNMSRYDIYHHNYVDETERIRVKYAVPVDLLRIEITESSAIGGMALMKSVIQKFHTLGYLVEMDDFGSGYSSLNILKDLEVDMIKLDMNFFKGELGGRGGVVVSSVVQMAKWLNTTVIAEGVETMEQADYMESIGCNYIQGYLYSKPLPEELFVEEIKQREHEPVIPAMNLIDTMNAGQFWNPTSMETLIFSNFVGAALLFTYNTHSRKMEILRVNKKYIQEIGMNFSEGEIIRGDPWSNFDKVNREIYENTIKRAIQSRNEEMCETWRLLHTKICGDDRICVRSCMRVIGVADNHYLIYAMVHNITAEKRNFQLLSESDRRLRYASEQAQVYAWEYTIATKQMRPCFRCMRDLNLPPVLNNYPDSVIEMGIFPEDYADMYRDWHHQIEMGVPKLEAVIPLTVGRVPFIVRYTTEYDELGKPVRAYGSATLVV
ncbi:MAG: EAL domain-containing protein, partial [Desulfovibrio sp.]|nr:EAL domain-containing protein [Desulfovibrio sp.]